MAEETNAKLVKYHFRTLLSYGRLVSFLGWLVFLAGFVAIIFSIVMLSKKGYALGSMSIIWGIVAAISGISLVIGGQVISCFVSIERNTRATYEALSKQLQS